MSIVSVFMFVFNGIVFSVLVALYFNPECPLCLYSCLFSTGSSFLFYLLFILIQNVHCVCIHVCFQRDRLFCFSCSFFLSRMSIVSVFMFVFNGIVFSVLVALSFYPECPLCLYSCLFSTGSSFLF